MAEQEIKVNTRNMKWMLIGIVVGAMCGMPIEAKLHLAERILSGLFGGS